MALARKNPPSDAVELTEQQAASYIWELVSGWTSPGDTWALRYGPGLLGGLSSLGGIFINSHFRTRLKLASYGQFSSVLPIVFLPGICSAFFHRQTVSTDMLLHKNESCTICYELRSAALQIGFGIVYPMVLAPTSAFMFANRYSTYRLPSLTKEPKQLFTFLVKISKPLKEPLLLLSVVHLIASSAITYFELRNHFTLSQKLREIEEKMENS